MSRARGSWGGDDIRVRFAPPQPGRYECRSICTDANDGGLHGQSCTIQADAYAGSNELLSRGPLRVSENRHHFEYADGTPFFCLADTWWMGLCHRIHCPDVFQMLTTHRVNQGYTVVQIIGGPYPDMDAFDPRGTNEAGAAPRRLQDRLLRGGNLTEYCLYPAAMRATWDLLRRYHQLETKSSTVKSFGIS